MLWLFLKKKKRNAVNSFNPWWEHYCNMKNICHKRIERLVRHAGREDKERSLTWYGTWKPIPLHRLPYHWISNHCLPQGPDKHGSFMYWPLASRAPQTGKAGNAESWIRGWRLRGDWYHPHCACQGFRHLSHIISFSCKISLPRWVLLWRCSQLCRSGCGLEGLVFAQLPS